ncbi:MAG: SH3 domain-containing protein [Lysinibacillus sp.]
MRQALQIIIACMLIFSIAMPNVSKAANDDLVVTAEVLNLREGPGLSYPILLKLEEGDTVSTIERSGDWIHVKAGNTEGWVAGWLTKANTKAGQNEAQRIIISQVNALNVRAEPSLSSTVLTQLSSGAEASYIKSENDWVQIQYGSTTGWVSSQYVTVKELSKKAANEKVETSIAGDAFTVTVDAVNVRKNADLTSKRIGVAYRGEQFKVLEQSDNWVRIQYKDNKEGWIYKFYGSFVEKEVKSASTSSPSKGSVTIIYDGTNMRQDASTSAAVVHRANAGETYSILKTEGDWYKVSLSGGKTAYVANWVVSQEKDNVTRKSSSTKKQKSERKKGTLKGLTLVIDAGHGGNDHGTTGVRGTDEKGITLKTAELLKSKLQAAGAEVIMTRESDVYVDLRKRVAVAHQVEADAFISLHYDATENSSVSGITTYYTNSHQKELAKYVHAGLADKVSLRDRGVQPGNYLVLRENRQKAILIELGFLSNPSEERAITTDYYREQATRGIYEGIVDFFDAQL